MPQPKTVLAIETSVVDLNYPKDGGNESLKHAFISGIPQLAASVGFSGIKDAPRKGDVVMIPAEILDGMSLAFAQETGILKNFPLGPLMEGNTPAETVRRILFGEPVMHAGGSLANTFDAMIYSKIDGQALYDGNFVCTVGADKAGQYFKDSFEGHIICKQGGRQMVSHIIPVDGDRVMITAPSFEDPSDKYFNASLLDNALLDEADIIMIGGYLKFAGHLDPVLLNLTQRNYTKTPQFVFTLAAQAIAADSNPLLLQDAGNLTIHGNTGEFRRHKRMDTQWRERFAHNFIGRDGKDLQGRELESVKNANVDYINAKQAANNAASEKAYIDANNEEGGDLSYVVTNGSKPARVINKDGIVQVPNLPVNKDRIKSTVGAGDNHVAGYWIGKALNRDEAGCLALAREFAAAVIQIPEARLPHRTMYKSEKSGKLFEGAIAALSDRTLDAI